MRCVLDVINVEYGRNSMEEKPLPILVCFAKNEYYRLLITTKRKKKQIKWVYFILLPYFDCEFIMIWLLPLRPHITLAMFRWGRLAYPLPVWCGPKTTSQHYANIHQRWKKRTTVCIQIMDWLSRGIVQIKKSYLSEMDYNKKNRGKDDGFGWGIEFIWHTGWMKVNYYYAFILFIFFIVFNAHIYMGDVWNQ